MFKRSKKLIAILIAVTMAATMGGWESKGTAKSSKEPITITIFGADSAKIYPLGIQTDPVAKEIQKQTGITMNVIDTLTTPEKLQVIIASGDLPDIVEVGGAQFKELIEGKMVRPLDDLLATNGSDILKYHKADVQFSKKNFSLGQNKVYFLPGMMDPNGKPAQVVAPYVRWDYYKELGYPQVKNYDDLINLVAAMLKKHPTNENGQKYYGFSPWFDWDVFAYGIFTGYMSGVQYTGAGALDGFNNFTRAYTSGVYDDKSVMWQGVDFWNKVYRKGLLDPDALTQKYDQSLQKGSENRILCEITSWHQGNTNNDLVKAGFKGRGMEPLPPFKGSIYNAGGASPLGNKDRSWCISSSCKNPERAMDLLNYFFSIDGSRTIINGVKGDAWTTVNGKNVETEKFKNTKKTDPNYILTTGATKYTNWAGLGNYYQVNGRPLQIIADKETEVSTYLDVDKDYVKHYGVTVKADVIAKYAKQYMSDSIVSSLATPTPPDDINRISQQIKAFAPTAFAPMVLAKNDAQLKSLKDKFKAQVIKMGYDKAWKWYSADYKRAVAEEKAFKASLK